MFELDKELDAFEKTLFKTLEVKYPEEVKEKLNELANDLMEAAKARTPIGTDKKTKSKRMKNRWRVGKVRKRRDGLYIEVKNTAPHAHLIEDGHRLVSENGETIGYVEGKHILLISVKELEERIAPNLQAWLNNMLKELAL